MDAQPAVLQTVAHDHAESLVVTRRGVIARLADPFLTTHDRWVLGQFAAFLSGRAPGPDPRVVRARPRQVLSSRVRRANL